MNAPANSPLSNGITVGIDWADRVHVVCVIDPRGNQTISTLPQSPDAIAEWVAELTRRFPGQTIPIAVEQSKGPLVHALMSYDNVQLYPLNPKQLAAYREALNPSGGKNDPGDAVLIAQFLRLHGERLRPWQPDSPATRKLARLTEIRRKMVQARQRLRLQLHSNLKRYFPLLIELFDQRPALQIALLKRWPTLHQLQRVHPKTLRAVLQEHGITNADRQSELITTIRKATPLTRDEAIIDPEALYAQSLARQIHELDQAIADLSGHIARQEAQHPDHKIFRSLPGAGDALAPRMIAAFGDDRDRYDSPEQIQCYSGIAPVTEQSGKTRHVSSRHACPKFLKQTFHEFADQARKWSPWSRAFYDHKRAAGFKHQAAVRALAFKWIRIIFRLWKTRSTYDETLYVTRLKQRNCVWAASLEIA